MNIIGVIKVVFGLKKHGLWVRVPLGVNLISLFLKNQLKSCLKK